MARRFSNISDNARRSSLFDIQRLPQRDQGSSIISLSDVPSISKRVTFSLAVLMNSFLLKREVYVSVLGPRVQYENTFKLEPDQKHDIYSIKTIVDELMEETFKDFKYDPFEVGPLCKKTSQIIRDTVKKLGFDRYKIVSTVTVSQNRGQGVKQASRFLWDAFRDNLIDSTFTNSSLIAQATLYVLYYE